MPSRNGACGRVTRQGSVEALLCLQVTLCLQVIFLDSFGRTQAQHLSAAWLQEVPHPHSLPSTAVGRIKCWKLGVSLRSFPQHFFPPTSETVGPYNPILLFFLFASHFLSAECKGSHFCSCREDGSVVALNRWRSEAQSSEETYWGSYKGHWQTSSPSFSLWAPGLLANPHSVLGTGWWQAPN